MVSEFDYRSKSGYVEEVAHYIIAKSIEMAKQTNNPNYYCDWYKIHKLMYYAQGAMLSHFNSHLFYGKIIAYDSGPMIEGIDFVAYQFGFDPIKELVEIDKNLLKNSELIFNNNQLNVMNSAVKVFGKLNRSEIISFSKREELWNEIYNNRSCDEHYPVIPTVAIKRFFDFKLKEYKDYTYHQKIRTIGDSKKYHK